MEKRPDSQGTNGAARKTGPQGLELIKSFEGLRLQRYQDVAGKWTVGYGHLILPTERFDQPINPGTALALLKKDLRRTEQGVNSAVRVPLTQNQFDALVSFAFNLGVGALQKSTLLRLLNLRDYSGAAKQFLVWNRAGGKVVAGLTRRRTAECSTFTISN